MIASLQDTIKVARINGLWRVQRNGRTFTHQKLKSAMARTMANNGATK